MSSNKLGFKTEGSGPHLARTIMLQELSTLFENVDDPEASIEQYQEAIIDKNCLGKKSGNTRKLTFGHLKDLYSLNPEVILFKGLRYFWDRDPAARPMLALLCAYARDPILRAITPKILTHEQNSQVTRGQVEEYIEEQYSSKFSPATLKSLAQNINSSLTQSGHLKGRVKKIRVAPQVSSGGIAYAVFLAYLEQKRGMSLFNNQYTHLFGCSSEQALEYFQFASSKGWVILKHIGDVVEVDFPKLIINGQANLSYE